VYSFISQPGSFNITVQWITCRQFITNHLLYGAVDNGRLESPNYYFRRLWHKRLEILDNDRPFSALPET
jgi:hypothetical protein